MSIEALIFWLLSAGAVGSAIGMILSKRSVTSALLLVLTFCFLAALYLTLQAQFLAVIQVAVYAGAIMVLVLFVIMLLNLRTETVSIGSTWTVRIGILGALAICAQICAVYAASQHAMPVGLSANALKNGTVEAVGFALYGTYTFAFELASLVLITAAVGAILLAKKRLV
jgi:NADH-quinone oxidoreductase subunit J